MARGKRHSDETRAGVIALLLAGQGVNEVAARYKLDTGLVSRWKASIPKDQLQQVAVRRGDRISQLLFEYLQEALITLKVQQKVFQDEAYLKSNTADNLAALHGVTCDKVVRLLEASQAASEPIGIMPGDAPGAGEFERIH